MRRDLHKLLLQKETVMMVTSRISPSPLDEADLKKKKQQFFNTSRTLHFLSREQSVFSPISRYHRNITRL